MSVHLAGERGVYLFLSGPTEGFLGGKTAAQTSWCNYESKPCRKSFDNIGNCCWNSARSDTFDEQSKAAGKPLNPQMAVRFNLGREYSIMHVQGDKQFNAKFVKL